MIKITLTHGATDGGRNFATMAVPKVESGLEKRCPTLGRHRERLFRSIGEKLVIEL